MFSFLELIVALYMKTVAAYKDENGVIHAVSPTCTHLGCRITWNAAERSWDCPCHGSRFDVEGNVCFNSSFFVFLVKG